MIPGDEIRVKGHPKQTFRVERVEGISVHCFEIEAKGSNGQLVLGRFRTFHINTVKKA